MANLGAKDTRCCLWRIGSRKTRLSADVSSSSYRGSSAHDRRQLDVTNFRYQSVILLNMLHALNNRQSFRVLHSPELALDDSDLLKLPINVRGS